MSAASRRLIVFTRYPTPGATKTRLISALGAEGAAALHRQLVEQTLRRARRVGDTAIEVRFTGADAEKMRKWLGEGVAYRPQPQGDLGARMLGCFEDAFADGCPSAILVGTDLPLLGVAHFNAAFAALEHDPLVFGPARDGGYYLVGMTRSCPSIFEGMTWSTDDVLEKTLERVRLRDLSYATIDALDDLDIPEDLEKFSETLKRQP